MGHYNKIGHGTWDNVYWVTQNEGRDRHGLENHGTLEFFFSMGHLCNNDQITLEFGINLRDSVV